MRYLIDTNVFIRIVNDDDISNNTRNILEDYENLIFVSSESIKEYIHLVQNGRIVFKKGMYLSDVFDLIENTFDLRIKYVTQEHLQTLTMLETVNGHNDPSDRLIIAQAITEKMPLISSDTQFPKYVKYGLDFISNC